MLPAFERDGMHIYAMRATYKLNGTFEDTYEDIFALGKILDCETRAAALVETMRVREAALNGMRAVMKEPPRVFVFDSQIVQRAFTCGQSLENGMIQAAGGRNIFADRTRMFVPVAWEDVARADPEVIIVHRFNSNEDANRKWRCCTADRNLLRLPPFATVKYMSSASNPYFRRWTMWMPLCKWWRGFKNARRINV